MKLVNAALAAGLLLAVSAPGAEAITIQFSCTGDQSNSQCTQSGSDGSTVSANLTFTQPEESIVEVVVENTSSTDFAPALLSFGFFVDPDEADDLSFSAFAFDDDGNDVDISTFWTVTQQSQGLSADFIADNGQGVRDGLYNPNVIGASGESLIAPNPFFTSATFTFQFDRPISLSFEDQNLGSGLNGSTFVRFQNTGPEGEGSAKVACTTSDTNCGGPTPVPEPGMLAMIGIGLLGTTLMMRRRRQAD